MTMPKPPEGTKISVRQDDHGVKLEFECPTVNGFTSFHQFDITDLWVECVRDLLEAQKIMEEAAFGAQDEPEGEPHDQVSWFMEMAKEFITRKKPKLAETALDGMLRAIMEGPDEAVIESLRVYQALWSELQGLKGKEVSRN